MTKADDKKKELAAAHKKIVTWFCEEYEKRLGHKYLFKRGKDGKSLQVIIKFCGPELTCRMIELMFEIDEPQYWDLSLLCMKINKYSALYHKKQQELPVGMTTKQEEAHYQKHRDRKGTNNQNAMSIGEILSKCMPKKLETKLQARPPKPKPHIDLPSDLLQHTKDELKEKLKIAETQGNNILANQILHEITRRT